MIAIAQNNCTLNNFEIFWMHWVSIHWLSVEDCKKILKWQFKKLGICLFLRWTVFWANLIIYHCLFFKWQAMWTEKDWSLVLMREKKKKAFVHTLS